MVTEPERTATSQPEGAISAFFSERPFEKAALAIITVLLIGIMVQLSALPDRIARAAADPCGTASYAPCHVEMSKGVYLARETINDLADGIRRGSSR